MQLELEWDQKFRERQRALAEQQDQLISSLCQARDEVNYFNTANQENVGSSYFVWPLDMKIEGVLAATL